MTEEEDMKDFEASLRQHYTGQLRKVSVSPTPNETGFRKGYFHRWEQFKDEERSCVYAIIEFEDGGVDRVEPHNIAFS
jgi:hypothetical protein